MRITIERMSIQSTHFFAGAFLLGLLLTACEGLLPENIEPYECGRSIKVECQPGIRFECSDGSRHSCEGNLSDGTGLAEVNCNGGIFGVCGPGGTFSCNGEFLSCHAIDDSSGSGNATGNPLRTASDGGLNASRDAGMADDNPPMPNALLDGGLPNVDSTDSMPSRNMEDVDMHVPMTPACSPSTARCAGETPQECSPNGEWTANTPCSAGERCADGSCQETNPVTCPDANDCRFECNEAILACELNEFQCPSNSDCELECDNNSGCSAATVLCTDAATCSLECSGNAACRNLKINAGTGVFELNCSGNGSCAGSPSQPLVIDCTGATSCTVNCDLNGACHHLELRCGDGPCTLNCAENGTCWGSQVKCGNGACDALHWQW